MNFNFTVWEELEIEVAVDRYEPDIPPPTAITPDSPNYADLGEDEIMEYRLFFVCRIEKNRLLVPIPDSLYPFFDDRIEDMIRTQAKDEEEYREGG